MSLTREPVAEIGDEDYRIVRHTHDVELAEKLMHAELVRDHVREMGSLADDDYDPVLGEPVQVWVRVVPALSNSWAASEGLRYTFNPANPNERGAFKAVVFR